MLSELAFSAEDLALTRFTVSPMWEVVTSFRLLASGRTHPVHRPWLDQVRPRVAAAGLDHGLLARLVTPSGYIPDLLTPPADEPAPDLATELAAIRATSADQVRADLDLLGRSGLRHPVPDVRLDELCAELEAYWDLALAPYWAKIRALLDADVFHRARQVAERGTGHLFNELHSTLRWDDNTLRMVRRHCALSRESTGPGLLLVPSAFTEQVYTWSRPPESPQLAYPARGTGTLWEHRPVARAEAIAAVIGRSRTRLLTELAAPASTTELARRTGISPAGVSQHLTALRDAGMVSAHRAGRSVLYARTAIAESFLGAPA
ncbi:ArsR/SmtB family transcription factor [Actinoallomurus rhizosphaericola]|uniref:ArsR/SmtB family transcription factor n=1 Tax=Actinoallomurus rhizosphaericola TaxID=2952536 RepID=UPI002093CB9E|nr:winged helix-turn-helix domain-containing protein [Actinoallomurus rhizosphaericola]MCO5997625.1 winged helix-turn-helix domain-containing protein [Actinoallomurus rhizosphaericola]